MAARNFKNKTVRLLLQRGAQTSFLKNGTQVSVIDMLNRDDYFKSGGKEKDQVLKIEIMQLINEASSSGGGGSSSSSSSSSGSGGGGGAAADEDGPSSQKRPRRDSE